MDLGNRLELFVDDYLIERMDGVGLRLATPQPQEVALRFDAPWEGRYCAYVTVLVDPNVEHLAARLKESIDRALAE